MAYKKYYKTIELERNDYKVIARVFSQDTKYGFRHVCTGLKITDLQAKRSLVDLCNTNIECRFCNRTWERWRFQSVLLKAVSILQPETYQFIKEKILY
jgi:hypothetical protein